MDFKEQTLEDIIWDNAQDLEGRKVLSDRGLYITGTIYRQVELGSYGRADLVTVDYDSYKDIINITIYELKKGRIDVNALMQAARYVTALERHGFITEIWKHKVEYKICLIGDSYDSKSDFAFLYNETKNFDIFTYEYDITGIYFYRVSKWWSQTNEVKNEETIKTISADLISQIKKISCDDSSE